MSELNHLGKNSTVMHDVDKPVHPMLKAFAELQILDLSSGLPSREEIERLTTGWDAGATYLQNVLETENPAKWTDFMQAFEAKRDEWVLLRNRLFPLGRQNPPVPLETYMAKQDLLNNTIHKDTVTLIENTYGFKENSVEQLALLHFLDDHKENNPKPDTRVNLDWV